MNLEEPIGKKSEFRLLVVKPNSMIPELHKLRRFALGAGLVLLLYSVAGIRLEAGAKASIFGIPFVINRPELLPLVLIIASFYGLLRFYYYGLVLLNSPYRHRKYLLSKLHAEGQYGTYKGSVYFGPSQFSTTPSTYDIGLAEKQAKDIIEAFPKFPGGRVSAEVKAYHGVDQKGELYVTYEAKIFIPRARRLVALIQDIDYTLPVWLNIAALAIAVVGL